MTLIAGSLIAASLAALWKNLLDEPAVYQCVKKFPYLLSRALTCGFCTTYWVSLVVVIANYSRAETWFEVISKWLTLALIATFIYYLFMIIQELSVILTHKHEAMHKKE